MTTPSPTAPLKPYKLIGEHIQALCVAPDFDAAEQLFVDHFTDWELSSSSVNETNAAELINWGVAEIPAAGPARILAAARGDLFELQPHEVYSWCHSTSQREEYPPFDTPVWTCDAHRIVRRGLFQFNPHLPLPSGEWLTAARQPIPDVLRWLPLEEAPDFPPPAPDLTAR